MKPSLREELEADKAEEREEDGDGGEWDRWMELSEEEQDRELEIGIRRYEERIASLTLDQQYRHHRRSCLKSCLRRRDIAKAMGNPDWTRQLLKDCQKRLLKIRDWRRTGVYLADQ